MLVTYNCGSSFINLSIYYQTIGWLNSKNNIALILMLLSLISSNKKKLTNDNKYLIFFFFCLYAYTPVELNQYQLAIVDNKININTNLTNGIMLVHPYILYFFYATFIYLFLFVFIDLFFLKFKKFKLKNHNFKKNLINIFVVVYISIILGCLWAEQELSWGG